MIEYSITDDLKPNGYLHAHNWWRLLWDIYLRRVKSGTTSYVAM